MVFAQGTQALLELLKPFIPPHRPARGRGVQRLVAVEFERLPAAPLLDSLEEHVLPDPRDPTLEGVAIALETFEGLKRSGEGILNEVFNVELVAKVGPD